MTINTHELLEVVSLLADEQKIKVCITQSLKGGAIAGGSAVLGGLLLGPIGLAIGGIMGSLTAASCSKDFRPLSQIICHDLTETQKQLLSVRFERIMSDLEITDLKYLMILVSSRVGLAEMVVKEIIAYAQNDLHLSVQQ